mmetsp:Transcript_58986/g.120819  ORF Transcript_58986/g.120819 Transcript_58986/m.120819 type:complete len:225 (-) Transcript_58986:469-1143(-)
MRFLCPIPGCRTSTYGLEIRPPAFCATTPKLTQPTPSFQIPQNVALAQCLRACEQLHPADRPRLIGGGVGLCHRIEVHLIRPLATLNEASVEPRVRLVLLPVLLHVRHRTSSRRHVPVIGVPPIRLFQGVVLELVLPRNGSVAHEPVVFLHEIVLALLLGEGRSPFASCLAIEGVVKHSFGMINGWKRPIDVRLSTSPCSSPLLCAPVSRTILCLEDSHVVEFV